MGATCKGETINLCVNLKMTTMKLFLKRFFFSRFSRRDICWCMVIVLLQGISFCASGQMQHLRFEHMGTPQGLSHSNVICVFQDSRGFMWFGTRDGLNRYDGYSFTVF